MTNLKRFFAVLHHTTIPSASVVVTTDWISTLLFPITAHILRSERQRISGQDNIMLNLGMEVFKNFTIRTVTN
jgi:hypothetical protein